ncbi:MAG: hypothetical protein LQ351_005054 [Letrouitia transgressa]|nr:MAG: hypothetical protein LQ351_005054 [Letrouitia transgressa]
MSAAISLSTRPKILANWSHHFRRLNTASDTLPKSLDALIVAAYFGHTSVVLKLISDGSFASSHAIALTWASRTDHFDVVKIFIEIGTPCRGQMVDGRGAISWAVERGFPNIVNLLLDHDPDLVNNTTADSSCLLLIAVGNEHVDIVEKLLSSHDIEVNLRNEDGSTAIHYAIKSTASSAAETRILWMLLRDTRFNITVRDKRGRSILSWATEYGATEAIKQLLEYRDRQAEINELLNDTGDDKGRSPLSWAAVMGHHEVVRILCKTKKIDRQLESVEGLDGNNAFALAARYGNAKVITELGRYYPEGVDVPDQTGRTPLSIAMWSKNTDVVRALLGLNADVDRPDCNGRTPVSFGSEWVEWVRVLVTEYSADINRRDNSGHTVLWYVKDRDDDDALAQIEEMGATM